MVIVGLEGKLTLGRPCQGKNLKSNNISACSGRVDVSSFLESRG